MTVYELVKKFEIFADYKGIQVTVNVVNSSELFFMGGASHFLKDDEMITKYGALEVIDWYVNMYGSLKINASC